LLRQVPAITELALVDPSGREQLKYRVLQWTWSRATPTAPRRRLLARL
jgi:hypothetical protein